MKKTITCVGSILISVLAASINIAQAQEQSKGVTATSGNETRNQFTDLLAQARPHGSAGFALMPSSSDTAAGRAAFSITPAAPVTNLPVFGSGTLGRLTKWTGFTSSNSTIGDSSIYEDKFGKVGIGTDSPASKLTVAGLIESSGAGGGVKFPDGTVQTTSASSALFTVVHDQTLTGSGTLASPLSIVQSEALIEPVAAGLDLTFNDGSNFGSGNSFTVPAGKRLVIEHVSARCVLDTGQRLVGFSISSTPSTPSSAVTLGLIPVSLGNFPAAFGDIFFVSQAIKTYGAPGTSVSASAVRNSASGGGSCLVAFSGFLVNLP